MSTHKYMNRICVAAVVFSLLITLLLMNGEALGLQAAEKVIGYENRLFDTSRVHTIEIVMDDWEGFIETCQREEYSACSVVIDGESYKNVGIRGKGNTSLSTVSSMGSSRYSFKIEFDQYDSAKSYHGLDKLSLNNLIQDNTMMKDFLTYQMMNAFGAASPLCSFVYIRVNGEDWGLYLAVEGVEEAFLQRNYGSDYGELYKPDNMSFGGGRGNGQDFDPSSIFGGGFNFGGASDVKLQYIDDDPDSYPNIFDNAKTDISKADKTRLISSLQSLSSFEDLESVLDMEAVLRYFVVHNFVVNGDSYTGSMIHNYYLYERDGRLSMIPWDYNLAFGTFSGGQAASSVNDPIDDVLSDRPMQSWIFSGETYTQRYHELYTEFLNTVDPVQIIEDAYALIAEYVEKDPTKFCTREEFETGVQALKSFCSLRTESVQGQLAGTIPSTSKGQSSESTALVNADGLNLSDMGTMNNGGGGPGGFGGPGSGTEPPGTFGGFGDDADEPGTFGGFGDGANGPGAFGRPGDGTDAPGAFGGFGDGTDAPGAFGGFGGEAEMPGAFGGPGSGEQENFSGFNPFTGSAGGPQQSDQKGLLIVSLFTLAAGLLIAFRYRRR